MGRRQRTNGLYELQQTMKNLGWGKKTANEKTKNCRKQDDRDDDGFTGIQSDFSAYEDEDFNDKLEACSNIDEYDTDTDDEDKANEADANQSPCRCAECLAQNRGVDSSWDGDQTVPNRRRNSGNDRDNNDDSNDTDGTTTYSRNDSRGRNTAIADDDDDNDSGNNSPNEEDDDDDCITANRVDSTNHKRKNRKGRKNVKEENEEIQVSKQWNSLYSKLLSSIFHWKRKNSTHIKGILNCKVDFKCRDVFLWLRIFKQAFKKWTTCMIAVKKLPGMVHDFETMKRVMILVNDFYDAIWIFRTLGKTLTELATKDIVVKNILHSEYQIWLKSLKEWYPTLTQLRTAKCD